ncbi:MAG: RluA family pseudouridine synthase [Clostridia bacterium]|nr:RluA family pseudouridine synthase [Clostridia bacterium]
MKILCDEKSFAVCEKSAGVLSQEGDGISMPSMLREELGCSDIYPVHRLDAAASGLMVFAKSRSAAAFLSAKIAQGEFIKEYLCVVSGRPAEEEGVYEDLLFKDSARNKSFVVKTERKGVKKAKLSYRVLGSAEASNGALSLVRVRLFTGRTHQIRVQFSSRGMPLYGDGKYGAKDNSGELALFSCYLSFPDPDTGDSLCFESSPPNKKPWDMFK